MLLSILIPVYNAEKHLEILLENLMHQVNSDVEIVLDDDGSTDCSINICRTYQKQYPNIVRIITRENHGAVFTRRELVETSRGEWIWIIDADDNIASNAYDIIRNTIENSDEEMVIFDYYSVDKDNKTKLTTLPFQNNTVFSDVKKRELYYLFVRENLNTNPLWTKVFKRKCFDFDEDYSELYDVRKANDLLQLLPIITNANSIKYIKQPLYYYYTDNSGSLSHVFQEYVYTSLVKVWTRLRFYLAVWGIEEETLQLYNNICCKSACNLLYRYYMADNIKGKNFADFCNRMMNDGVYSSGIMGAKLSDLGISTRIVAGPMKKKNYTKAARRLKLLSVYRKLKK